MKKNTISIIVVAALAAVLLFLTVNKDNKYKEIEKYVNDNYKELETIAKEYQKGGSYKYDVDKIKDIKVYKIKDTEIVCFLFFDEKTSYGFYYSEQDVAVPYKSSNTELIQTGKSEWIWSKTNESEGKIKQIRKKWFYYQRTSK